MKQTLLLATLLVTLFANEGIAQPWTYDFGTGTASHTSSTSTTFLSSLPAGTSWTRVGTGAGGFHLENPGTTLGSGTELRAVAPSATSINKQSIQNYTASKVGYVKYGVRFDGGSSGTWFFFIGDGSTYGDASTFSGTQNMVGFQWVFGATDAITFTYRGGGSWISTGISGTPFAQKANYEVEIYYNNSTTSQNYTRGTNQSMAANTFDLWIDGVLVGNDLAKGQLANDSNIDSFMFYGASSTGNVATIYLDNIEYSNALPSTPTVALANTGTPATGNILQNTTDAVLFGFALTPSASVDFTAVNIATSGTATTDDISNFRLIVDSDNDGIADAGEISAAEATVATLANPLAFTGITQTIATVTRYLVIADVSGSATAGRTITASIAVASDVTSTGDESGTAAGNAQTFTSAAAPTISVSTSSLTSFGNVVAGSASTSQSFTVSGNNLTDDVTVTAPSGFTVSLESDGVYGSSVNLLQSGGDLTGEPVSVFVRFEPSVATGATGSLNVTVSSDNTEFSSENVSISGNAIDSEPSTQATGITFGTVTTTSIVVNWTRGNGDNVIILAKSGSAVDANPADASSYTANAAFGSGSEIGTGNRVVYIGTDATVTVTGLSSSTTYHFAAYEFNVGTGTSHNYNVTGAAVGSQMTDAPAEGLQISALSTQYLIDFDNTVSNINSSVFNAPATWGASSPSAGQLNSNAWSFSQTSLTAAASFGGNLSTPAGGGQQASGGVVTGASIYSFQVSSGNYAWGIQPSGSQWSAGGNLTLKVQNKTGASIQSLLIQYKIYVFNDQARSTTIGFRHSSDNATYTELPALNYSSTLTADGSPAWTAIEREVVLNFSASEIANNGFVYLRWTGVDNGGSGSRDEFAIDDISVTANYFETSLTGTSGWRMMSNPVSGKTYSDLLSGVWTQGFTGANSPSNGVSNLLTYNFSSFASVSNITNAMTAGQGFVFYAFEDDDYNAGGVQGGFPKTLSLSGTENAGPVSPSLNPTNKSGGVDNVNGWSLIGNPFAATIDWDLVTKSNVEAPAYVYNTGTAAYISWNGATGDLTNGLIAPFQGFFVQTAESGTPSITIEAADKTTGGTFRGKEAGVAAVRLEIAGAGLSNTAFLQFSADGDAGFDRLDSWKLLPLDPTYAVMGTVVSGKLLDINSLPAPESRLEMPLDFSATKTGRFTLRINQNTTAGLHFSVRDNTTGSVTSLNGENGFTFDYTKAAKAVTSVDLSRPTVATAKDPRFTLIVEPTTTSNETIVTPTKLALSQNYPNPFNPTTAIKYALPAQSDVTLSVIDLSGRVVDILARGVKSAGEYTVSWNAAGQASGVYMLRLEAGGQVFTKKMTLLK